MSQLKPTSGRDVSRLFNGASGSNAISVRSRNIQDVQASIGGFDGIIQKRKEISNPLKSVAKLETNPRLSCHRERVSNVLKSSRSAHDFLREWRMHCTNAKATLSFLTRMDSNVESLLIVDPEVICKDYFSAEIDSDFMGDIVEALYLLVTMSALGRKELLINEASVSPFIHSWLKALSSCGRIELSVSFLTQEQQTQLKEVCAFLCDAGYGADEFNLYSSRMQLTSAVSGENYQFGDTHRKCIQVPILPNTAASILN